MVPTFLSKRPQYFTGEIKVYKTSEYRSTKTGKRKKYPRWVLRVETEALKHMGWTDRKGKFKFVPDEARDLMILLPPYHKPKPPFDFENKALGKLKKPFKCREWKEEDFEELHAYLGITPYVVHIKPPQRNNKNRKLRRLFEDQKKRNFKDYDRFMEYKKYKYLVEAVPQDHAAGTESVQRI